MLDMEAKLVLFFFFQAEDGIRDDLVTGVQTCALPILQAACSECAGTTEQIKSPHPPETFAVTFSKTRPGAAEVFFPREQRLVIVRPDVLDIVQDENTFRGAHQLSRGRKNRVWKNVARDPGIGGESRRVAADSLAEKQSVIV